MPSSCLISRVEMLLSGFTKRRWGWRWWSSCFSCHHHLFTCLRIVDMWSKMLLQSFSALKGLVIQVSLLCLSIQFRIQFKVLVITYRALCGEVPAYVRGLLQLYINSRSLRSSAQGLLVVPQARLFRTVFMLVAWFYFIYTLCDDEMRDSWNK